MTERTENMWWSSQETTSSVEYTAGIVQIFVGLTLNMKYNCEELTVLDRPHSPFGVCD